MEAVIIVDGVKDDGGNVIPCVVIDNEKGYHLTNWSWGKDIEVAKKLADEYNEKLGVSKEDVNRLVLQSM